MIVRALRSIVANRRVRDVLALLDRSPLPAQLILKASVTFGTPAEPDGGFTDIRRVRERLQQMAEAGLVAICEYATSGHGAMNFYHLTPLGYRALYQMDPSLIDRQFFRAIAPTVREHRYALGQVVVHTLVAAQRCGVRIVRFHRENAFAIEVGGRVQKPDGMWRFERAEMVFNHLFEVDMGTAPLDAPGRTSIRSKLATYEAYYDGVWQAWKRQGGRGHRPRFRVAFFAPSRQRMEHILILARQLARNADRHLCYAVTMENYLATAEALTEPIFLDHHGRWDALVNVHPSVPFQLPPVRLRRPASDTVFPA